MHPSARIGFVRYCLKATIAKVQPILSDSDQKNQVCKFPLSERDLLRAVERAGFQRVSVGFVAVCNAPDSARNDPALAGAMVEAARQEAREAAQLIQAVAPGLLSDAELSEWLEAIDAGCRERLRILERGERLWEIGVSMIMVARGVKP